MTGIMTQKEFLEGYERRPFTVERIMADRLKEFGKEGEKVFERRYYDYDEQCWVTDKYTSSVRFDPYREETVLGEGLVLGWWTDTICHSYNRTPVDCPVLYKDHYEGTKLIKGKYNNREEYLQYLKRLPSSKTTITTLKDEPWLSDAKRRREAPADEE